MTRIRWCSLVGCWYQLPQASSCISVKLYHTASGLCCMINTSHWRMVFGKPCNCLHRMCSHSVCCVIAFCCGGLVYCLFIRTLGLQVMTSLLQCSSVWSVCASLIWNSFPCDCHIYVSLSLTTCTVGFHYFHMFWLKTTTIFREVHTTCCAGCQLQLVKCLYMLVSFINTVLLTVRKM